MSSNLGWAPKPQPKTRWLNDRLKFALRKRFGGIIDTTEMGEKDLLYLQGLYDAGLEDARKLIDAIRKHGTIIIKEEF